MRFYILGLYFAALTVLCAYKENPQPLLGISQTALLSEDNVLDSTIYTEKIHFCGGQPLYPSVIDLGLINSSFHVYDKKSLLFYLANNFKTNAQRVKEVLRITIAYRSH